MSASRFIRKDGPDSIATKEEIEKLAVADEVIIRWNECKTIKKVVVPGRLVNIGRFEPPRRQVFLRFEI